MIYSTSSVNITGSSGTQNLGGLIGAAKIMTVSNPSATRNVTTVGGLAIGGLIGFLNGTTVSDCYATGSVSAGTSSTYVGSAWGEIQTETVSRVNATGSVTGQTSVGGLAGRATGVTFNKSY